MKEIKNKKRCKKVKNVKKEKMRTDAMKSTNGKYLENKNMF